MKKFLFLFILFGNFVFAQNVFHTIRGLRKEQTWTYKNILQLLNEPVKTKQKAEAKYEALVRNLFFYQLSEKLGYYYTQSPLLNPTDKEKSQKIFPKNSNEFPKEFVVKTAILDQKCGLDFKKLYCEYPQKNTREFAEQLLKNYQELQEIVTSKDDKNLKKFNTDMIWADFMVNKEIVEQWGDSAKEIETKKLMTEAKNTIPKFLETYQKIRDL